MVLLPRAIELDSMMILPVVVTMLPPSVTGLANINTAPVLLIPVFVFSAVVLTPLMKFVATVPIVSPLVSL